MHRNKFLFIDWISPENHNGFNQAFFGAIDVKNASVIFFNKNCRVNNQNIKYIDKPKQGRFARMLSVYMLAIKSKKPIFFLTYDHLCIIPLLLFKKNIFVFEHNTTPYSHEKIKSIIQKIFLKKLNRFCQFPQQHERLLEIKQKSYYIGSPLLKINHINNTTNPKCIIIQSNRVSRNSVKVINDCAKKYNIVIRNSSLKGAKIDIKDLNPSIEVVEWLDVEEKHSNIEGILIATDDDLRGSGWFNEAISRGLCILFIYENMSNIFASTFPNYNYSVIKNAAEIEKGIGTFEKFSDEDLNNLIINYNNKFSDRYENNININS
ncbi:MAG: hypothetical protein P8L43_00055 [Candidatus Marinimicrobia bacterium]|nr:hypothetical protein [Candidatus Neomarinimicrobiota bacterium]